MSEKSAISEISIGKQIGATTGVSTRGLYVYGEAWSAYNEDKMYFTFKTLALRDRKGQEKLVYIEGDGDIGSGASQSWYVTANAGTGLGKLDTGSFDAVTSQWYYLYVVYNADTQDIGGIYSLDKKYPSFNNIPGYTFYRRISALRTTPTEFRNIKQFDEKAIYYTPRSIAAPAGGSALTWEALDISAYIPPVARIGNFVFGNNARGGGMSRESDGHGGWYMQMNNSAYSNDFDNSDLCPANRYTWSSMAIPIFGATSVYYYYLASANPYISTTGWEDNLSIYY